MKGKAKKVWDWIKNNPWALLVALSGVFGAYLIFKSKNNKIASLTDAVVVQTTMGDIKANEAKANTIRKQADVKDEEVADIDSRIAKSKRRVVEIHEGGRTDVEAMSDDEVAKLFSDSDF